MENIGSANSCGILLAEKIPSTQNNNFTTKLFKKNNELKNEVQQMKETVSTFNYK